MPISIEQRPELPPKLSLRVVTDVAAEEKRSAAPPEHEDAWETSLSRECSPTSDDERSATIPTTAELEPLDDATSATITFALQSLTTHDDWLEQHEAITVLRRVLVHHVALLSDDDVLVLVPALVTASDNLRSALSKNALMALGECCECLRLARLEEFLTTSDTRAVVPLVDVLLRRATCEKRFLRDAANDAVDRMLLHLASPALIAAAATYAANKNAKIVALASKIMALSFAHLRTRDAWHVEAFASGVYEALAKFRAGKDSGARSESLACLRLLGEALGRVRFDETLQRALPTSQRHSITSIVTEVFPPVAAAPAAGRRGSLRDRVLLQQQVQPSDI